MNFKGVAGVTLALVLALSGCSGGGDDGAPSSGGGTSGDDYMKQSCKVTVDGDSYGVGIGYPMKDYPLYTFDGSQATLSDETIPANTRVCFDAVSATETEDANGGQTMEIVPVWWADEPDKQLYIKRDGHGGTDEEMCTMSVEKGNTSCEGDPEYFQIDREASEANKS